MRLTLVLLLLVAVVCLTVGYGQPLEDNSVKDNDKELTLLSLVDQGDQHGNEGAREARAFGFGRRGYYRGGYGGGYGGGGYYRGGYGRGGFGRYGYGRGGYGGYGYGRGGFGRYGYGYGR